MKNKSSKKFVILGCVLFFIVLCVGFFVLKVFYRARVIGKSMNPSVEANTSVVTLSVVAPNVSVVVPVYNSAEFLPACLESILSQTMPEIEIICVNDGSKDNSLAVLNEYKSRDPRVIVIDKPNGGVSSARNAGIKAAKGKYIEFLDSDDLIHPKTCENLFKEAEYFGADIVRFNKTWFQRNETPNVNAPLEHDFKEPGVQHCYHHDEAENPFVGDGAPECDVIHTKIYKKDFLQKYGIFFDEKVRYGEDSLFCWMTFMRTSTVVVDENIYYYQRTDVDTSLSRISSWQNRFDNHMLTIKHLLDHEDEIKFRGHKEWMLDVAVVFASNIFKFGSDKDKAKNAKTFLELADRILADKDVFVSKNNASSIQKIRNLVK